MTDEQTMLAAYAAHFDSPTARLILADWFDDRDDPRGAWLRDAELAKLMGPTVETPVPKLMAKLPTKKAAKLLTQIGRHAVPAILTEMAKHSEYSDERKALRALLGDIADGSDLAAEIAGLQADDPRDQKAALDTLAALGERGMAAAGPILGLLKHERGSIREAAVRTLAKLGPAADAGLLAVHAELEYDDRDTSSVLHDEVVKRGPQSPAVRIVLNDLGRLNYDILESAQGSLHRLGGDLFEELLARGPHAERERESTYADALRQTPDADARLLAVARDPQRELDARTFAIKTLVNCFHDEERSASADRDWLLPHLLALTDDPSGSVAHTAAVQLGYFGDKAADAVPAIVRILDRHARLGNRYEAERLIYALANIGPPAVSAADLVRQLAEENPSYFQHAARQFEKKVLPAEDRSTSLRAALHSRHPQERAEAVWQLVDQDATPLADLAELLEKAITDKSPLVRERAAHSFGYACQQWPELVAFPSQHLGHRDPVVREKLAEWLSRFDQARRRLWPEILARLKVEPKPAIRVHLLDTLTQAHWSESRDPAFVAPPVRAALKAALTDTDEQVRAKAVNVIACNWEQPPDDLIPALFRLAAKDTGDAGNNAIGLLCKVERCRPRLLKLLRTRLKTYPKRWEFQTFESLNNLKYTPTKAEWPKLLAGIQEQNTSFAFAAAGILGRAGAKVVPHLIPLLADGLPNQLRTAVALALTAIGPPAREAVPALLEAVNADSDWPSRAAVEAVVAILPREDAIETLRPLFRHRRVWVQAAMKDVAKQFGAAARPWLPELLDLAGIDEVCYSNSVHELLVPIFKHEPALLAELLPLLDEPPPAVTTALAVIAMLGPLAKVAEPKLRELLAEADENLAHRLRYALDAINKTG